MKKFNKICVTLLCMLVIATGATTYVSRSGKVFGDEIDVHGSVVTRALMRDISVHMTEILGAILRGDSTTVTREANEIGKIAGSIMSEFFPTDGQVGRKFKVSDKSMKGRFEEFVQIIIDNSKNIATASEEEDFTQAYESFDALLRKACLSCHKTTRDDWLGLVSSGDH